MAQTRDRVTGGVFIADMIHGFIHQGRLWTASVFNSSLSASGVMNLLIQVPAAMEAHARFTFNVGHNCSIEVFEGTTFSNAGSAATVRNRRRSVAGSPGVTVTTGPTLSLDGTSLFAGFVPGGGLIAAGGGEGHSFEEWIMKASTNYLVRLSNNLVASAAPAQQILDWYEVA